MISKSISGLAILLLVLCSAGTSTLIPRIATGAMIESSVRWPIWAMPCPTKRSATSCDVTALRRPHRGSTQRPGASSFVHTWRCSRALTSSRLKCSRYVSGHLLRAVFRSSREPTRGGGRHHASSERGVDGAGRQKCDHG